VVGSGLGESPAGQARGFSLPPESCSGKSVVNTTLASSLIIIKQPISYLRAFSMRGLTTGFAFNFFAMRRV